MDRSAEVALTRAVLFCDMVDSTALRARVGDVSADGIVNELFAALRAVVELHGGEVTKTLGDGVMAAFPGASGALLAATAMLDTVAGPIRGHAVDLRVGVSIGDVAGRDGDWHGLPVVEAARLCAAARPSSVLVGDLVRAMAGSRTELVFVSAGSLVLKGLASPVEAWWVSRPVAMTEARDRTLPEGLLLARRGPFVGRHRLVGDTVDQWADGSWRTLLIAGEPGIGKSRLSAEVAARLSDRDALVLFGRCDEDVAAPLRPWVEALGDVASLLDGAALSERHGPSVSAFVPSLRSGVVPSEVASTPGELLDALRALLGALGARQPTVVVLDDLHWIDPLSLTLLRRIAEAPVEGASLIATYRDTDIDASHRLTAALGDLRRAPQVQRISLSGLDADAVADYCAQTTGSELHDRAHVVAAAVHAETAGNPLFIGEVLRHLVDAGLLLHDNAGAAVPEVPPEGLRDVIGRRLARLGPEVNEVLQVAGVAGRSFEVDVVEAVLARDVVGALEAATRAGIVVETGSAFEFRHAVLREVVLSELSTIRRQRLHARVAEVLDLRVTMPASGQQLQLLAFHHWMGRTPDAAHWGVAAARDAVDRGHAEAAIEWVGRVESLAERHDGSDGLDAGVRCDLLILDANTRVLIGGDNSLQPIREALRAAIALNDEQRIVWAASSILMPTTGGAVTEHAELIADCLAALGGSTSIGRWRLEAAQLTVERVAGTISPAAHLARTFAIIEHLDGDDPEHRVVVRVLAVGLTMMGSLRAAHTIFGAPSPLTVRIDRGLALASFSAASVCVGLGQRTEAERLYDALDAAIGRSSSNWMIEAQRLQHRIMRALLDGRWDEARALLTTTDADAARHGNFALGAAVQRAWLARETGDPQRVHRASTQALAGAATLPVVRATAVSAAAEAGDLPTAAAMLDELAPDDFAAVGRGWTTLMALTELAWGAIATEAHDHAGVLARLLDEFGGLAPPLASGVYVPCAVDRLLAGLASLSGDHTRADQLYTAALDMERSIGSRPLAARTLCWWARDLLRRGEPARARPLLAEALDEARALGMPALVAQIEELERSS